VTDELIDSYSETNKDGSFALTHVHPSDEAKYSSVAQSFKALLGTRISTCKFYLAKTLLPVGNLAARLYAHTGTYGSTGVPTGSVLAESSPVTMESLGTDFALTTFVFPAGQKYKLTVGTSYVLACVALDATTLDTNNYPSVGRDSSAPTHSGNLSNYINSAWFESVYDGCFYLYGCEYPNTDDMLFSTLLRRLGITRGSPSLSVTRHALYLGATRDTVTGWYPKSYYESAVDAAIIPKSSQGLALSAGYYVSLDGLGFTQGVCHAGDLWADGSGRHWEVKTAVPNTVGDTLYFYQCDLKELPLNG
jgi:hypothetical protein